MQTTSFCFPRETASGSNCAQVHQLYMRQHPIQLIGTLLCPLQIPPFALCPSDEQFRQLQPSCSAFCTASPLLGAASVFDLAQQQPSAAVSQRNAAKIAVFSDIPFKQQQQHPDGMAQTLQMAKSSPQPSAEPQRSPPCSPRPSSKMRS